MLGIALALKQDLALGFVGLQDVPPDPALEPRELRKENISERKWSSGNHSMEQIKFFISL